MLAPTQIVQGKWISRTRAEANANANANSNVNLTNERATCIAWILLSMIMAACIKFHLYLNFCHLCTAHKTVQVILRDLPPKIVKKPSQINKQSFLLACNTLPQTEKHVLRAGCSQYPWGSPMKTMPIRQNYSEILTVFFINNQ